MSVGPQIGNEESTDFAECVARFRSRPLPDEATILRKSGDAGNPVVSIICTTYNHRPFIDDAMKGFLLQRCSFPFEVIVHDDASTDGTQDVVSRYALTYPKIVRHIQQPTNLFSTGARPLAVALQSARGEFIATCEGDDFWIDERKLERQVASLRARPDAVISSHDALIIDASGAVLRASKLPAQLRSSRTPEQLLLLDAWLLSLTWMVRRNALRFPPEINRVLNRDTFMTSVFGTVGAAIYETDLLPAVYRSHEGGVWSPLPAGRQLVERMNTFFWLYQFHTRAGNSSAADHFRRQFLARLWRDRALRRGLLALLLLDKPRRLLARIASRFRGRRSN